MTRDGMEQLIKKEGRSGLSAMKEDIVSKLVLQKRRLSANGELSRPLLEDRV